MSNFASRADPPVPEMEDDGGAVTVRCRHGQSQLQEVIILLDSAKDRLIRREFHARLASGVSDRQVRRKLEELRDKGLGVSKNRGPLTRWSRGQGAR